MIALGIARAIKEPVPMRPAPSIENKFAATQSVVKVSIPPEFKTATLLVLVCLFSNDASVVNCMAIINEEGKTVGDELVVLVTEAAVAEVDVATTIAGAVKDGAALLLEEEVSSTVLFGELDDD